MKHNKQILVLLFAFLVPTITGNAQEYFPFPQDSAVWYTVNSWPEYNPPPPVWYTTSKYMTNGDTIIDSIVYTKLFSSSALDRSPYYHGAYRVDTANEHVYFVDAEYGTESLLYDFSLVPGDTIHISGSDYETYNLICLDTSNMIINNIPHRTYYIYSSLSNGTECFTTWVEGIGSLRMPTETDWFCAASFEWRYDLSCFYYKEEHIYEWDDNPYFEGCIGTNVGIEEINDKNIFSIAPNPVTGVSRLLASNDNNDVFDYRIIDVNGNILQSRTNAKSTDIIIHKNQLKKGIYVLQLYAQKDGHFYFIKFISR